LIGYRVVELKGQIRAEKENEDDNRRTDKSATRKSSKSREREET
jgi:hypothetical protein